jgi:hypothetical protein
VPERDLSVGGALRTNIHGSPAYGKKEEHSQKGGTVREGTTCSPVRVPILRCAHSYRQPTRTDGLPAATSQGKRRTTLVRHGLAPHVGAAARRRYQSDAGTAGAWAGHLSPFFLLSGP